MKLSKFIALALLTANILVIVPQATAETQSDYIQVDDADLKTMKARETVFTRVKTFLFGTDLNAATTDSGGLQKLKIMMRKREFATWFRFRDEVGDGINKELGTLDALVKPVATAQEGFLVKLMMVRQAKYTVDLTYYIFSPDESGLALINELKRAIKRGVSVRVMVDSVGSLAGTATNGNMHFKSLIDYAKENAGFMLDPTTGKRSNVRARVEVVTFNPISNIPALVRDAYVAVASEVQEIAKPGKKQDLSHTLWNPNRRSHDKILITDAEFPALSVAIIGGRNISNHYYAIDPKDPANFHDTEVLLRATPKQAREPNPDKTISGVISRYYDRLWFHRANRRMMRGLALGTLVSEEEQNQEMEKATAQVKNVTAETLKALGEDINSPDFGKKYLQTGFVDQDVDFVHSAHNLLRPTSKLSKAISETTDVVDSATILADANKAENSQALLSQVVRLMSQEKQEVVVITPYLWLSDRDVTFIKDWLRKDSKRRFIVYTNSVVTSDNIPAQALVDMVTAPKLMAGSKPGTIDPQARVYEYGRIDDVVLGGTKVYGKLHYKGAYFKSLKKSLITTYNKDPRSQILNSESGVIIAGQDYARRMEEEIAAIHSNSHLWGTEEYRAIRSNRNLSKFQRTVIRNQKKVYELLMTLKLWWLI